MTTPLGPPDEAPPDPAVPSAAPPGPPEEPRASTEPKYLIGLGVVAAIVLLAGTIAVVARSDSQDARSTPATTSASTSTNRPTSTTSTTITTTSTTSTTTTSSTSTTTVAPLPVNSNAGEDQVADVGAEVTLSAIELSEPGQTLVWWQLSGPDVTADEGRLRGNDAVFEAPSRPATLRFRLDVTGRAGDVASDEIRIDVLEDADRAVFVDAGAGDDANDGSVERPFRTLGQAVAFTSGASTDIYLRSVEPGYSIDGVSIDAGTSLYGGYVDDWVRDMTRPAEVRGTLLLLDSERVSISAVNVRGADATGGETSYGMVATGIGDLLIESATIRAGDADSGPSIGLATQSVARIVIDGSSITAGRAGDGRDGSDADDAGDSGADGGSAPANPPEAATGGGNGGAGGSGGIGLAPGERGELSTGGDGGDPGENGRAGSGGPGGPGGDGGRGGAGIAAGPRGADGADGTAGEQGAGGGGGGGGGGLLVHDGGGAGGGGGGGGGGGAGGGGAGGQGSVGAWLVGADSVLVSESTIQGGMAGRGGTGGTGGAGGTGGRGGDGALGVSTFLETSGTGGGGGGGGAGGSGGGGGGGAGGRSVGLLSDQVSAIDVSGSVIRGGAGGAGGAGGEPGTTGRSGADGAEQLGGAGGFGRGDTATSGAGSSGGDSVGWWDAGDADLTVADTTVEGGGPGEAGGADGTDGRSIDTIF